MSFPVSIIPSFPAATGNLCSCILDGKKVYLHSVKAEVVTLFTSHVINPKALPALRGGYNSLLINSLENQCRGLRKKRRCFSCAQIITKTISL